VNSDRVRVLVAGVLGLLGLLGVSAWQSWAQTGCDPVPQATVQVQAGGVVSIQTTQPMAAVQFYAAPNAWIQRADGTWVQPPVVLVPAGATPQQLTFTVAAADGSVAVPHVPFTITWTNAACAGWTSFVGWGTAGLVPTVVPTPTPTPTPVQAATATPTPWPTPTVVVAPTATVVPPSVSELWYLSTPVYPDNMLVVGWVAQPATTTDYVAIVRVADGVVMGPPVFTSSCTSVAGGVARATGLCGIYLTRQFPPGQYWLRLYGANNSSNVLATAAQVLEVRPLGAAFEFRGRLWGMVSSATVEGIHPYGILVWGGFIGGKAQINWGDTLAYRFPRWHHVGLFANHNAWIEAGTQEQCDDFEGCWSNPYMSWIDRLTGRAQSAVWDGEFGYPRLRLPTLYFYRYEFAVYRVGETAWTGQMCDASRVCCHLWLTGLPCREPTAQDTPPQMPVTALPWYFGGSESITPDWPGGITRVAEPWVCCEWGTNPPLWLSVDCWSSWATSANPDRIRTQLEYCLHAGDGWVTHHVWR
jgi:hypothetical protein